MNSRQTKEYWNDRARKYDEPKELVFNDVFYDEFNENVRMILSHYSDRKVLDVGCGFGRLSDMFENYIGIDFSEEMIKKAKTRYPGKTFAVLDWKNIPDKHDVIFEVMCLSSFGVTAREFYETVKDKAPIVMCLEPKKFTIFYQ
jgi:ubiquinone/menaquinone biosynthesis C-methylase UbiE